MSKPAEAECGNDETLQECSGGIGRVWIRAAGLMSSFSSEVVSVKCCLMVCSHLCNVPTGRLTEVHLICLPYVLRLIFPLGEIHFVGVDTGITLPKTKLN